MSVYFIANIRMKDEEAYRPYLKDVDAILAKYAGEYLAVEDNPRVLEGDWPYTRLVLIRFPDEESLTRWYFSAEYQAILRYRLDGAECDTVVVRGKA
ncbi:MAG: DUF1330 domain-containing protein [Clostridia bacterium]|nr:DUF1330 domain-containing protein [Clostridia bacterium]